MSKSSPRGSSRGSNSSSSSRPASRGYDFTAEGEVGQFGVNYVPGKGNVRWYSGSFDFQGLPTFFSLPAPLDSGQPILAIDW